MEFFVTSDVHADFWVQLWQPKFDPSKDDYIPHFDKIFEWFFKPAENLIIAGDIANDTDTYIAFVKYISTKYKKVYICPGNHDFVVKGGTLFGNGNAADKSEVKWSWIVHYFMHYPQIVFLDNGVLHDGVIAGTYGACDLYSGSPWEGYTDRKIHYKKWFDCRYQNWENYNTAYRADPTKLWHWQKEIMMNAVKQHPKIMVTHFCPAELGHHRLYTNCTSNAYFFFNGKEFLEELDDGAIWICGHIHHWADAVWTNSKGNKIKIIARPLGYPGESPADDGYITDYSEDPHGVGKLAIFDKANQFINIEV